MKGFVVFALLCAGLQVFVAPSWPDSPYPEPEAKQWLKDAPQDTFFASHRFSTKQAADRFLDKLYAAGAIYVGVIDIMGDVTGLRIYLPLDGEKRKEIFEIANYELTHSNYPAEDDTGKEEVVIWF